MYIYIYIQWWIFSSIQNPHPPKKKHTHPSRDSSSVFFTHPDDLRLGSDIGLGISPLAHQHHSQARFRSSAFFKALDSTFQLLGTVGTWIVEIRGENPTVPFGSVQKPLVDSMGINLPTVQTQRICEFTPDFWGSDGQNEEIQFFEGELELRCADRNLSVAPEFPIVMGF